MKAMRSGRWFPFMPLLLIAGGLLVLSAPAGAASGPILSIRYFGGVEGELHLSKVGLMYGQYPDTDINENGKSCGGLYQHGFLGARFFFKGPRDSWYLGLLQHTRTLLNNGTCSSQALADHEGSGLGLTAGYHWLWGSGLNLDLGIRPGFIGASIIGLAIGISF